MALILSTKETRQEFQSQAYRRMLNDNLDNKCCNCGATEGDIQFHHIVPISCGGQNSLTNIVRICADCHSKAHDLKTTRSSGGGRPSLKIEDYECVLKEYFDRKIGRKEAQERMGITKSPFFKLKKEYMTKHGIKEFKNTIDVKIANGKQ